MSVIKEFLVVEDLLAEAIAYIPDFENEGTSFPVRFKYGDEDELNAFLSNTNSALDPYPLVWLVYPYTEVHLRNKVECTGISLVLATSTTAALYSEERMEATFKTVLIPLFDYIRKMFQQASNMDANDNFEVIKFPNYSVIKENETEQIVIARWDALKLNFNAKFNSNCLKPLSL